jgi:hypothetical protein
MLFTFSAGSSTNWRFCLLWHSLAMQTLTAKEAHFVYIFRWQLCNLALLIALALIGDADFWMSL